MRKQDFLEIGFHRVRFLPQIIICRGAQMSFILTQPPKIHAALAVEVIYCHHDGGMPVVLISFVEQLALVLGNQIGNPFPVRDLKTNAGIVQHFVQPVDCHADAVKIAQVSQLNQQASDIACPDLR